MVVDVKNVTIGYMVGDFRDIGLKDLIARKIKGTYSVKTFNAVENVSFSLNRGDFLGIIGRNGAGKSTLLKAISGVMEPLEGSITVDGNVSALLELGAGFDSEMTVKENTMLRGALMGYSKATMQQEYDRIIEFAELKEFEGYRFSQLSSGMKSRLAFSVASLIKPEILVVDEVLSVGDGAFREKSEKKMLEIMRGGVTTIFVSHSVGQIRKLCNKALWLEKGKTMAFGDTRSVCNEYDKFLKSLNK